jgi:hypothetical protein
METLLLLQQFNNNASDLVDEAITKLKYWKGKFNARGMKPTPEEIEAEYTAILKNLMKSMRQVTQKTLAGNENQELAARVRGEGQRFIKKFVDECSPTPPDQGNE